MGQRPRQSGLDLPVPVFKRILLVCDSPTAARQAFARTLELATGGNSVLAFMSVIRARELALDVCVQTALETAVAQFDHELAPLRRRASFAGLPTTTLIGIGHPARQIVLAADTWHADLIVTCRHRDRSRIRWLSHSLSDDLAARAHCAVLVVQ